MKNLKAVLVAIVACLTINGAIAQVQYHGGGHGHPSNHDGTEQPALHVNPKWRECSFQLNENLSQQEWREFAKEAGLVIYFRPLTDARSMGAGNFEVSVLQWSTGIDEHKGAWNDTFVHPDSTHWLVGGSRLPIMGITGRIGLTDKLDVGVYLTKNPGANYGFYGAQIQYNVLPKSVKGFNAAVRGSGMRMYGPDDMDLTVFGADITASKEFVVNEKWLRVSPYVVGSTYLSVAQERSDVVDLEDEGYTGFQASAGILAKIAFARLAVEYNHAAVNTVSMKIGVGF